MEKNQRFTVIVVIVIVAFILGCLGGWTFKKIPTPSIDEQYRRVVDSLEQVIQKKEKQYDSLYVLRTELEVAVKEINDKLKALEKHYGQQVIDITTYTNPQLERFFTDRYGN